MYQNQSDFNPLKFQIAVLAKKDDDWNPDAELSATKSILTAIFGGFD